MKQSSSSHQHNSLITYFGDEEIEVCEIILKLPHLILESESPHRFPFTWGAKRRRSMIDLSPPPPPCHHSPSSLPGTCQGEAERPITKVEASSPATPLSFSPSESDEKSKRKASKKRKDDWLEIIDGLTQRRELLKGEIETVKRYHDELKAFNLELKARKHELSLCLEKEKPYLEISKSLNLGVGLGHPTIQSHPLEKQENQQIPIILHQPPYQTAYGSQIYEKFQYLYGQMPPLLSSGTRLGMVNHVGPLGIPDLNLSAEETVGMDSIQSFDLNRNLNRAIAAQARKKRLQIKRMKNSIAEMKPYYCR